MKSIRAKLIAPFLIGLFVTSLLLSLYTYDAAMKSMHRAVLTVSEAKTNQVYASMSLLFRSLMSALQNLSSDMYITAIFREGGRANTERSAREWVGALAQGNDYYRDILVTDTTGTCILSSNPGNIGKSFADSEPVDRALKGMFSLGEFSVGLITKKLSAMGAGPIDVDGKLAGTLVVVCDFPNIVDYEMDGQYETDKIFTYLLQPDGSFAAHVEWELVKEKDKGFVDLYGWLQNSYREEGPVEYTVKGESYIGYARYEPVSRWVVVTSAKTREIFASARVMGSTVFGISLLGLLVISSIVLRFSSGILNSLLSLIDYAKRVSEGDIDSKLGETERTDELGVLHRSLVRLVETMQTMIRQTQEISRMKGEFLANMSHEIRTPINAIIGMAHLSLRDKEISERQRDYLGKIQTAARSLLGIINDILDVSKIEAGKLVIERTIFEIRKLLNDTLVIHQVNARSKSLIIEMNCADDVPAFLIGDPLRIGQILNNLLSNAVKFTQKGGVTVYCSLAGRDGALARISFVVTDTGIGIGRDALEKLFQPFTQADSSITRKFGGTGLGLTISLSLVEMMGGKFEVHSSLGEGSIFSLMLPLEVSEDANAAAEPDAPDAEDFGRLALHGKFILIAEDNMINQMILEELIAPAGATTMLVENGKMAVDAVCENQVDLIFMDMQMPVMDGLQATREIRARGYEMPIVAVTANAMNEERKEGFSAGMSAYITKPVELQQLYETLKLYMGK